MTQNPKLLAMGLAGGYLLGRTRKAKLALTVASVVLGRRMGVNPQRLLTEGVKKLSDSPEFSRLEEQIRDELMAAGRSMVTAAANRRMDSLSDALSDRTAALSGLDQTSGAEDEGTGEEQASGEEEQGEEEQGEEEKEEPRARKSPPKKSPSQDTRRKKSAPQEAPAKKSSGADGKTASRQAATKKSTARGTAAKKAASRSTGRR